MSFSKPVLQLISYRKVLSRASVFVYALGLNCLLMLLIFISMILDGGIAADHIGCGTRYALNRFEPAISFGGKTFRSEFPWHVALYRHNITDKTPEYICGGSIIHRKVILTAAHCVYDDNNHGIDSGTFIVVAGKYYVSWELRDPSEQRIKVLNIKIPKTYVGFLNRYAEDIALLELNTTLNFSSAVLPVCIDWSSEYFAGQLPSVGLVVGWGRTENETLSDELLMANLKYIDFTMCRDRVANVFSIFITSDKFCAGLDNGTAVERGDSGGGLTFPLNTTNNKGQYYLYGVVSLKDTERRNIAVFTDIRKHLHWLNNTLLSITDPGLFEPGCPPLSSNSVSLALCNLNGTYVDCNRNAKLGTKAKLHCKGSYHTGSPFKLYTETECSAGLKWLPLPLSCIDCGKRYRFNHIIPLVKYKPRTVSEFPWQVALYEKNYDDYAEGPRLLCGAAIIHPKAVITAAHCVYNETALEVRNETDFLVAAGKFKSSWKEQGPAEQRFQVRKIFIKDTFQGQNYYGDHDIALLELNATINLSDYIMPVCMDWGRKLNLHRYPLILGTIAGWGYTEEDKISNELRASNLRYIERAKCLNLSKRGYRIFIGPDKFCATPIDGSTPERGDSGGPFTFPYFNGETGEKLNYFYGILTSRSRSVTQDLLVFTNVTYHLEWIRTVIVSIINNNGTIAADHPDGSIAANYPDGGIAADLQDCGKRYRFNQTIPLVNSKQRTASEFPWQVALYEINDDDSEGPRFLCGASIIHPKAVITGAQCVYNETALEVRNETNILVAAGKFKSKWKEQEPAEQRFQVKKILIHDDYFGERWYYHHNIAVLELNATIHISDYIMPVCMDWGEKLNLHRNPLILGTAPGWGFSNEDIIRSKSVELRALNFHYMERIECINLAQTHHSITQARGSLGTDKFCATSVNDSTPVYGYSGIPLTFPYYNKETGEELNYLYGIASSKLHIHDQIIFIFTNVTYHSDWIKTVLVSINYNNNNS